MGRGQKRTNSGVESWNLCYTCGGSGVVEDTTYLYTTGEDEMLNVETYGEQIACTTVCPDCLGLRVVSNCEEPDHRLPLEDQLRSAP